MITQTLINRVQSKSHYAHRLSVVLSFERLPLSALTYPQVIKDANLLGSIATVGMKLKKGDRVEIIHIQTRITDVDMEIITSYDGYEYMYNIKLKDAVIDIGDEYEIDDLLGQVVYVKINLKNKEKDELK